MTLPVRKSLHDAVLQASKADTWEQATKEWNEVSLIFNGIGRSNCVCGNAIKYAYELFNGVTGQRLFPIGSDCVRHFHRLSLDQQLEEEEKKLFLEDLGIGESGLDKLVKASYSLLGLISFLTAGPMETRAWTIRKGTKAQQAAGKIHSDIERGFIRAETISFAELVASGGNMVAAKEKGLVRLEGKEYIMQDGDVVYFRFNV